MPEQEQRGPGGAARPPPPGDGEAKRTGYGAGGLGSGADRAEGRPDVHDAPGVSPAGEIRRSAGPDTLDPGYAADNPEDQPPARQ